MKKSLLVVIALVVVVAAGGWWFSRPKPIPVKLYTVAPGKVEATLANTRAGSVEACLRSKLTTIVGGRIEYLGVKEGDRVKKGQLLLRLWNDDLMAQQKLAGAQLELSKRRVVEACTAAANARRDAVRTHDLRQKGFVSAAQEDTANTNAAVKEATCATAQADVKQAEANASVVRVGEGRISLIAPFDGTVAKIVGEVGEYSTPSPPGVPTPPAIDLIDDSCLYIDAPMDELDAPKIHPGQPVRIRLDAYGNKVFEGKVRRVAPYVTAVEKQARTVDVEIDFARPEEEKGLLVGYSADVEILLETHDSVPRIPTAALQEGNKVLLVGADGRLEARKVALGLANWEYSEVTEGLKAGDRIVLSLEKEGVKAGARVVEEKSAENK